MSLLLLFRPRGVGGPVMLDSITTGRIAFGRTGDLEDASVLAGHPARPRPGTPTEPLDGTLAKPHAGDIEPA